MFLVAKSNKSASDSAAMEYHVSALTIALQAFVVRRIRRFIFVLPMISFQVFLVRSVVDKGVPKLFPLMLETSSPTAFVSWARISPTTVLSW